MHAPNRSTSARIAGAALATFALVRAAHAAPIATSVVNAAWDSGGNAFWSSDSGQTLTWGAGFDFAKSSVAQSSVAVNGTQQDSDLAYDFDWTYRRAESSLSAAPGTAQGTGTADDTTMRGEASAKATAAGEVSASGYAAHAGRFTVSGAGTLTFSFPYTYTITTSRDDIDQAAYGYMRGTMSLDNYGPDPAHNPRPYVPLTSVYDYSPSIGFGLSPGTGALSATLADDGLMTLSLHFDDGDKGYFAIGFTSEASAYAPTAPHPVPAPLTAPLLLLGGLGLLALGRSSAMRGHYARIRANAAR